PASGSCADSVMSRPKIQRGRPVIYAEISVRCTSIEELDDALPAELFVREPLPYEAAFLAGKVFYCLPSAAEESEPLFRTSTLALTPQSQAIAFSPEIFGDIERTFPRSSSSSSVHAAHRSEV